MNATERPTPAERTRITDPEAVRKLHARLLVPNFPASELVAADSLADDVASGASTAWAVGDPADPVAVAITDTFDSSPAVLLSYFATREDQRGRGVGSALLAGLLAGIAAEPDVSVVLAEVEHPGHHAAHPVHGDPAARLRFYGRLGGRILSLPYFQPPIDDSQDAVYGMLLLALDPPERFVRDARLVPAAGVHAAVSEIMAQADPARYPVAETLRAAAHPDGVPLLAPEDWESAPVGLPVR